MRPLELMTFKIRQFSITPAQIGNYLFVNNTNYFSSDLSKYYSYERLPIAQERVVVNEISLVQSIGNFEFNISSQAQKSKGSDSSKSPNPTKNNGKKGSEINEEIMQAAKQYNYLIFALKILGIIAVVGLVIFISIKILKKRAEFIEFEEHQDDEKRIPSPAPEDINWQEGTHPSSKLKVN